MPWIPFRLAGGIDLVCIGAFLHDFHGEPQRQRRESIMWLDLQWVVQQFVVRMENLKTQKKQKNYQEAFLHDGHKMNGTVD